MPVIDVDGSYLYKKYKALNESGKQVSLPSIPSPPLTGWTIVTSENFQSVAAFVPRVSHGKFYKELMSAIPYKANLRILLLIFITFSHPFLGLLYAYLAGHVGLIGDQGAFRALSRGYTHWASGRVDELQVNTNNPLCCHVKCKMKPSMKTGVYNTYILLGRKEEVTSVRLATCECAAGYVFY